MGNKGNKENKGDNGDKGVDKEGDKEDKGDIPFLFFVSFPLSSVHSGKRSVPSALDTTTRFFIASCLVFEKMALFTGVEMI